MNPCSCSIYQCRTQSKCSRLDWYFESNASVKVGLDGNRSATLSVWCKVMAFRLYLCISLPPRTSLCSTRQTSLNVLFIKYFIITNNCSLWLAHRLGKYSGAQCCVMNVYVKPPTLNALCNLSPYLLVFPELSHTPAGLFMCVSSHAICCTPGPCFNSLRSFVLGKPSIITVIIT